MRYLLNVLGSVDVRDLVTVVLMLTVPTIFCLLIWNKSLLVSSIGRKLATLVLLSLFGWAIVGASIYFGPMPENGAAIVFGLMFGWAYVWLLGMPVILLAVGLRGVVACGRWVRRKATGREAFARPPVWSVVILLFASLVVYPIVLCCTPNEMWKDWGGRQYRTKSVEGIVHVQICEAGGITDVRTDASSYHRFNIVPRSIDELELESSDVGTRYIRKVDGKWTWQMVRDRIVPEAL